MSIKVSGAFVLVAACAAPPPAAIAPTEALPSQRAAPPAATSGAPATSPAPAASSDEGSPPDPPMAVRWTLQLAPVGGQPGTTQRFALLESGDVTWESARAGGDGDVDEELSPARPQAPEVERCRGHVGPTRHRKLVAAARHAMASGCAQTAGKDRLGHPTDAAVTTVAVTWAGETKTCDLGRSGGGYATFEQLKTEAIAAICTRR
jgi:hypothetical protein